MGNTEAITPTSNSQLLSPILFITGPTASGKSDLAMRVAEEFNGEIICADSQTVRQGMNIGTAKPSKEDQRVVPHHLLDIIEPDDRFTVAEFKDRAEEAIAEIQGRGRLPIVVGGTGLYIDALLYGFSFRSQTSSKYTRVDLESMSVDELQNIIHKFGYVMPKNAHNPRHLIRVIESEGQEPQKNSMRGSAIVIGLDPGKEALENRIALRIDLMLSGGLLEEYDMLIKKYGHPKNGFDGVEYRIVSEHRGADTNELRQKLIIGDRQYAKKQRSWMKRNQDIIWFDDLSDAFEHIAKLL